MKRESIIVLTVLILIAFLVFMQVESTFGNVTLENNDANEADLNEIVLPKSYFNQILIITGAIIFIVWYYYRTIKKY
ncbi:MAG: hypothetical protein ABIH20_02400 [Candidatus Diapherotrites archaeon]